MNWIGMLVLTESVCILRAWCIKVAWAWFLVPLGVPPIGVAWAWGLFHLLTLLRPFPETGKEPPKATDVVVHALATLAILGSAWVGHWAMR